MAKTMKSYTFEEDGTGLTMFGQAAKYFEDEEKFDNFIAICGSAWFDITKVFCEHPELKTEAIQCYLDLLQEMGSEEDES